jgi:hypothetical protein|uniref:Uncharacterized protein n=1 Tax=Myoviridae sp. ctshb19 TaxID=2825194 RepID=A0A8S5UGJ6_9CAUD|nr:MAG TPA: hypothetical protein [Myoviridae sp. ctshb19]
MATSIASRFARTGDSFLLDDNDLGGGYRSVATVAARDAIPLGARRLGMVVYVQADKTEYQLRASLTNASWEQRPLFSGKAHTVAQIVSVGSMFQYDPYTFEQYANQRVREWFNALPQANRVLNKPIYYFKILFALGAPASLAQGSGLPTGMEYFGDATFVYDTAGSALPVTLDVSSLVCLAKTLIPLGDAVIDAMNEYADRKASEAP